MSRTSPWQKWRTSPWHFVTDISVYMTLISLAFRDVDVPGKSDVDLPGISLALISKVPPFFVRFPRFWMVVTLISPVLNVRFPVFLKGRCAPLKVGDICPVFERTMCPAECGSQFPRFLWFRNATERHVFFTATVDSTSNSLVMLTASVRLSESEYIENALSLSILPPPLCFFL